MQPSHTEQRSQQESAEHREHGPEVVLISLDQQAREALADLAVPVIGPFGLIV